MTFIFPNPLVMLHRLALIFSILTSCQMPTPSSTPEGNCWNCKPLIRFEAQVPSLKFVGDMRIDAMAGYLAAQDRVESEQVGFSGTFSEVYQEYVKLKTQASMEQLIQLLQHKSPNVRYYALLGLISRDPEFKTYYYQKLSGKYDSLTSQGGCVVSSGELWEFAKYRVFEAENWREEELGEE